MKILKTKKNPEDHAYLSMMECEMMIDGMMRSINEKKQFSNKSDLKRDELW